jgi:hypothetical protein
MRAAAALRVALVAVAVLPGAAKKERLEAGSVVIEFSEGEQSLAENAARLFEEVRDDLAVRLGIRLTRPVTLSLCASDAEFQQKVAGHPIERWVAAVAIPTLSQIVVRGSGADARSTDLFRPLLRHEVCHLMIGEVEAQGRVRVPVWFNEGLAQFAAGQLVVPEADVAMLDRYGFIVPLVQLEDAFPASEGDARIAYLQAESFVRFAIDRSGIGGIRSTLARVRQGLDFAEAFHAGMGREIYQLEREWHEWLRHEYSLPYLIARSIPCFAIVSLIVIAAFIVRWFRARRLLKHMDDEATDEPTIDQGEPESPPGADAL